MKARPESGFTVVEVMIASGVMLAAIMALLNTVTTGIAATALSRQRQSASGLANQTVEQIRALPLDRLRKGLNSSDTTGDTNIKTCGVNKCFNSTSSGQPERLVLDPLASAVTPLNPHRRSGVVVGPTSFNISAYITWFENGTTTDAFRVTTIVTWKSIRGPTKQAQAQTILHYPAGCLSTATRPFSGPCVAAFSTQGIAPAGTLHVSPHVDTDTGAVSSISGIPLTSAELSGPKVAADLRVEQITVANAAAQTSGARIQQPSQDPEDIAIKVGAAQANNDPDQPGSLYSSSNSPAQAADVRQFTAPNGSTLNVNIATGGDTGKATATGSALSPTRNCPNLTGFADKIDSLPCASGAMQQSSTTNAQIDLVSAGTHLGNATIASVGPQTGQSTVITQLLKAAVTGKCPTPAGDGCAHVEVSRAPQTMQSVGCLRVSPLRRVGRLNRALYSSPASPTAWRRQRERAALLPLRRPRPARSRIGTAALITRRTWRT